jgi:hypothetical protein
LAFTGKTEAIVVGISPEGDPKSDQVKDKAGKGHVQNILMMEKQVENERVNE